MKTLFLIKYVKSFKPTLGNIAILIVPTLDPDFQIDLFKKEIKINLEELDQKTFIRKNGSNYEYLTDLEKDVDNEIKNTLIENTDKMDVLKELLYSEILPENTVKLQNGKNLYDFGKKINDTPISSGQTKEFNVNVTLSVDGNYGESQVASSSMGVDDLLIFIAQDSRLSAELTRYCQTKKYLKLAQRDSTDPEKVTTIQAHETHNHQRRAELLNLLQQSVLDAPVYINGTQQQLSSTTDAKTKIIFGLQHLAEITYSRMSELSPAAQEDIKATTAQSDNIFIDMGLTAPEQEILSKITLDKTLSNRLTVDELIRHFRAKPYGWNEWAVANCIATLVKKGKVKLTKDSTEIQQANLFEALTNSRVRPLVLIAPEQEFSVEQVATVKDTAREYFNRSIEESEPKKVAAEFKLLAQEELQEVSNLYARREQFPFLDTLSQTIDVLAAIKDRDNEYYFKELSPAIVQLRQDKDDIAQIKAFFASGQKEKYLQAKTYIKENESNFGYLDDQITLDQLRSLLGDPKPYAGGTIPAIYNAYTSLKQQVDSVLEEKKAQATSEVDTKINELFSMEQFSQLTEEQKEQVSSGLTELHSSVSQADNLPLIELRRQDVGKTFTECLNNIANISTTGSEPVMNYIQATTLRPRYHKTTLDSEQDINDYIEQMRQEYLDALKKNKGITL